VHGRRLLVLHESARFFSSEDKDTFNPRGYSLEELALIERALELMLAGQSAGREPEAIPPDER
jgi:hypothetical protein